MDNSWQLTLEILFESNINLFPIPNKSKNIKDWLNQLDVDFFVLSGGNNIGSEPDRDSVEEKIINYSINKNIPILAICRGMQYLHISEGGELIRSTNHINVPHKINLMGGSNQDKSILVNSFHEFCIKKINNKKFNAIAFSDDGHIEAMIHNRYPWLAIMWHPERVFQNNYSSIVFLKNHLDILLKK